jgi:hypothetical protein
MPRKILILLAFLGSLLVAPTVAHAQGAEPDGPTYQIPSVGECHDLTVASYLLMSTPTTPVDCAEEHTALVSAVVVLPADTDWDRGGADLEAARIQYCLPAFYETLGGKFKLIAKTAFTSRYWIPTQEQRSHGALWFRCDINLPGVASYLPLPDPLLVGNRVPERIRNCIMVLDSGTFASSCQDQYNYRFEKAFVLPGTAYPKRAVVKKFARSHCPSAKRDLPHWILWSNRDMWSYGDHTMICFSQA